MAEPIDEYFRSAVAALAARPARSGFAPPGTDDPVRPGTELTTRATLDLFDDQLASRHLDLAARWLRARGQGYYTIGSSGHESNAAVAAALRPTDPALLHYRSGGFFLARARQVGGSDPVRDVALGLVAATTEPIANRALAAILATDPGALVFGEDVARKGGVYGVTRGLQKKFGSTRVFDTLLDEQAILGLALGAGVSGLLPIPEIQYLAYLHNAADQIRGEAATLQFFSQRAYRNPMAVRIALRPPQGFGGRLHNGDAIAALRDIPGIVVASPSRTDDDAGMLRTCAAAASPHGRTRSSSSSPRATPPRRSPRSCSSASRRSTAIAPTSSPSWACVTVSTSPATRFAPGSSSPDRIDDDAG